MRRAGWARLAWLGIVPLPMALTACASSPSTGTVEGRLEAAGGPAPGATSPLAGTVKMRGAPGSYVARAGSSGRYVFHVPPGNYIMTASSPQFSSGHGTCGPGRVVPPFRHAPFIYVTSGTVIHTVVACSRR